MASAADRDPPRHIQKMQGLRARYLRRNIGKVDERPLITLCEISSKELIGLETAFGNDER